jgi:putative oxidoreductase
MTSKNIGVIKRFMQTKAPMEVILIRFLTGTVFFLEGIKKFLFPGDWGVGRFVKIGIPAPEVLAPFVGAVEIVCGFLVLWGLFTRLAAIPLIIVISVAIATTKIPILLNSGFWPMEDHARTDYSMLMGLLFLLVIGGGKLSLDALLSRSKNLKSRA